MCWPAGLIKHGHAGTAILQGLGKAGTRYSGADHSHARRARRRGAAFRARKPRFQSFSLASVPGLFLDVESSRFQTAPHRACDGECCCACAGLRSSSDLWPQAIRPHGIILGRAESIQEPGIGLEPGLRQRLLDHANMQRQRQALFRPYDLTHAFGAFRPSSAQFACQFSQLRPRHERFCSVFRIKQEAFKTDKVQPAICAAILPPHLPSGEEIQPSSKAKLGNRKDGA